jgi:hypothetical protein
MRSSRTHVSKFVAIWRMLTVFEMASMIPELHSHPKRATDVAVEQAEDKQ